MFSNNNKLSTRQVFRLFVFDFVGESTLVLPAQLASSAGNDGVFAILLGGALTGIYLWYLSRALQGMNTDLLAYMEQSLPVWLGKTILVFLTVHFILMAGYGAWLFSDVMKQGLIGGESHTLILILVLLVAGYAVSGGIESRARVYEVLFPALFILLLIMMVIAFKDVDTNYLQPFFTTSVSQVAKGSMPVMFCFSPVFLVLFFPSYVQKDKWGKLVKAAAGAIVFAVAVIAVFYVVLLGSFGAGALSVMQYPAVTLMSSIHLQGSFLKRLDAFMIGIWFFTLFALLNVFLFYGQDVIRHLFKKGGNVKKPRLFLCPSLVLVFLAAELFARTDFIGMFLNYISCFAGPLLVALPAAVLIFGKAGKKG